jgi:hypothetical protein
MQIKTTLRFHFTPVIMAIIKGNNNKKWWRWCSETGTLIHCWWECKFVQPLQRAVWRFLKKLQVELPYDPVIPLLGVYPKEHKTGHSRDNCTLMFIATLFTIAKLWKQTRCLTTDKGIMKLWLIYTQWSITQPQGIMTWGLKVNGCNWRT